MFKDKTKDSRYDGTFTTVYRGNWSTNGKDWTTVSDLAGGSLPYTIRAHVLLR